MSQLHTSGSLGDSFGSSGEGARLTHFAADITEKEALCQSGSSDNLLNDHLIICHRDSGDLYYSRMAAKSPPPYRPKPSSPGLQSPASMVGQPRFMRCLLTILHAVTCIASGFCFVFSLFGTIFSRQCLPNLMNSDGSLVNFEHGFANMCHAAVYGFGAVFAVSLVLCVTVPLWINKTGMLFIAFMLTSCIGAFSVYAGTAFTVHYSLWCDSIAQGNSFGSMGCAKAAALLDEEKDGIQMVSFQTEMEVQQIAIWALFPLTFINVVAYAAVMHRSGGGGPQAYSTSEEEEPLLRGFYQYLATRADEGTHRDSDETTPFITPVAT